MKCIYGDKEAQAVCRFCGRAVCSDHIQKMNYIVSIFPGEKGKSKALVVAEAVYCGVCKPLPEPVDLPTIP